MPPRARKAAKMTDPVVGTGTDPLPPVEAAPAEPDPDDTAEAVPIAFVPAVTGWRVVTPFDGHPIGDTLAANDPRGPALAGAGLVVPF